MKQSSFKRTDDDKFFDRIMHVSADSKDELDDTITAHTPDGWREKSRTVSQDGTFMATLIRSR